jgi:hypothetical protein
MMNQRIKNITPLNNHTLIVDTPKRQGIFDVKPYLHSEVFQPLNDINNFKKVINHDYYIEWDCGADLSADTIETLMKVKKQ